MPPGPSSRPTYLALPEPEQYDRLHEPDAHAVSQQTLRGVPGQGLGLGADDNAFAHDYHSTFLNSGLSFNMALALFPFTAYGGGLVILPWDGAVFTVSALDPSGTATNNDIGDAFQDGVLVAAEGRVTIKPLAWWATSSWGRVEQQGACLARAGSLQLGAAARDQQFPAWPILARS